MNSKEGTALLVRRTRIDTHCQCLIIGKQTRAMTGYEHIPSYRTCRHGRGEEVYGIQRR